MLLYVIKVFGSIKIAEAREISCESITNDGGWGWSVNWTKVKTCNMEKVTVINDQDVTISTRDESIGELNFSFNRNISFLPIGVAETFPNLLGYFAKSCAIKTVSKANFRGLRKLTILWLRANQIEKISSDTFADLNDLARLNLCELFFLFFNIL